MANVIDVSASGEPDAAILTETATSGVLGGSFLRERPLAAYLDDAEVPQFVLRNKRSGLRIEPAADEETTADESTADVSTDDPPTPSETTDATTNEPMEATGQPREDLEPSSNYQALAAVTDVRVVFVVGTAEGDRSVSMPLSDVAAVDVAGGLLGSELTITTAADDRYVFPCRGDLDPVADYVDVGAQAWTHAYSMLDAADAHLAAADRLRTMDEYGLAIVAIDAGESAVDDALDRIASHGDGARARLGPTVADRREVFAERRRTVHVDHGVDAHERARKHWGNRQYERAHEAYHEARAALQRAQELETTAGIDARLDRIDHELTDLADAPLAYAQAMVEEAEASDDPRTTAQCWEVAIERFRDVYALDWGRSTDRFSGDPTAIRERILSAIDELVDHRRAGIEDRLDEAEWLRQSDDIAGAREVIDEAEATLERTERLVAELSHGTYPELEEARREIEADRTVLPEG